MRGETGPGHRSSLSLVPHPHLAFHSPTKAQRENPDLVLGADALLTSIECDCTGPLPWNGE